MNPTKFYGLERFVVTQISSTLSRVTHNPKHDFTRPKEFQQQINHFFEVILPDISGSLDSRINDNFQVL